MSRLRTLLYLVILVCLAQALTAAAVPWLGAYYHAPADLLRPLLMAAMTAGLLVLVFWRGQSLSRGECLALLCGTAGGLANLVDVLHFGAVADFIPVAPATLASPGDLLILGGFLSFPIVSLRHAREGHGLYGLFRHWRSQICMHLLECLRS